MQGNKTICFFNSTDAWGGGEKWHLNTSVILKNKTFKVKLFISENASWKNLVEDNKIPFEKIKVGNLSFLNPFKVLKTKSLIKKNNAHTVILNLPRDLKLVGIAAKLAGVKHIVYRRGSAIPIKNTFLNRYIFKNIVTSILTNSEKTKETINQNNSNLFPKDKIAVIYNGIDIDEFENRKFSSVYESNDNEIVIGNVGRLVEQKAQDKLLELSSVLENKKIKHKILIGGEGKLLTYLQAKAKELSVEDNIVFTGFVKDIKSFMESIDVFVLTSKWEGFGYVLVEAMVCKKPVIAFDISSNPEIIKDKETGFLVPAFDIDILSEKLMELSENKELCTRLGENAYARVVNLFSIEKTIDKLLSLNFISECKS